MTEGSTRTCIGCRRRAPAAELLRLVLVGRAVIAARGGRGRWSGRGASVHPQPGCVAAAIKSRAFGRAFRQDVAVPQDVEGIGAFVQDILASKQMAGNTGKTP